MLLNRADGLPAVTAFGNDLDIGFLLQQRKHALTREGLVVDDQSSNLVHATLSISTSGWESG
jgi:hypothetical protein